MKTITPAELQKLLAVQPSALVVDVRTPVEFAEVHVPQAQSIPLDELKPGSLQLLKDQPVYLLCHSGQRATKAAEKLMKDGFSQLVVVEGGTLAWIEANLPVTRGTVKVISLERQVRIAAGAIVLQACCSRSLRIRTLSGCRVLWARGWFLPALQIFAAWLCYWQKCLGISATGSAQK